MTLSEVGTRTVTVLRTITTFLSSSVGCLTVVPGTLDRLAVVLVMSSYLCNFTATLVEDYIKSPQ